MTLPAWDDGPIIHGPTPSNNNKMISTRLGMSRIYEKGKLNVKNKKAIEGYQFKSGMFCRTGHSWTSGSTPRGQDIQFITPKYPFQFVPDFFLFKVDEIRYNTSV